MKITLDIFASLLAIAVTVSALGKFKKMPDVMKAMASVGVKENQISLLALLELAAGIGLVAGIWSKALGQAASIGLVLYFAGALTAHLRKKHKVADFGPALGILIVAVITTVLQLKR
jgi:uncharacterized membrane protein YphA (DoxX/SURF4 family)